VFNGNAVSIRTLPLSPLPLLMFQYSQFILILLMLILRVYIYLVSSKRRNCLCLIKVLLILDWRRHRFVGNEQRGFGGIVIGGMESFGLSHDGA